ncbi:unnamed protein product [Bursaphelenchus xylophilus]|uniref:(pine wood nematode) hypothetical protein n=1 Tax=Bursaphelenchus xylophilus TaxID=6326 RepID=A0A1I7RIG1_BURXY|nr:unnamed protein product [Bursaphelenchus xylophilus]CAG9080795.1 unnamed protein product [Bursaphelenchus xylophilus]
MKEAAITSLIQWAKNEGAVMDLVEVKYCGEDRGCGVFAKKTIRLNETFLRIPKHLMITAGMVADMPEYKNILERHRVEAFSILVMFFYLESQRKEDAFFHPYFASLPKTFDTPLAQNYVDLEKKFTMEELPKRAMELLMKQKNEFIYLREQLSRVLDTRHIDIPHLNWAWHVVNTRCVYLENPEHPLVENSKLTDTLAIIPVMDMLNHSPNAQALAFFDKHSNTYCVNAEYRCVNEGDEIFVCYGPHDNLRLWVEYGFSIPHNIFNRVDIPNNVLFALAAAIGLDVSEEKKRIIDELAIPNTMYLSDVKPSFGLQKNVSILLMSKMELKDVKNRIYGADATNATLEVVYRIIEHLKGLLEKRVRTALPTFKHFWSEQVELLQNIINQQSDDGDSD